jgi:hypothetical protein
MVMMAVLALSWQEPPQSYCSTPLSTPFGRADISGEAMNIIVDKQAIVKINTFLLKLAPSPAKSISLSS